jgi:hypothetical protein
MATGGVLRLPKFTGDSGVLGLADALIVTQHS